MSNSTWDDISDGISKAAKAVGNAAGDAFTYGKKTVKTVSAKCELREKFCELGRVVSEESETGIPAGEKKGQLLKDIVNIKRKLYRTKNEDSGPAVAVLVCSKCGQSLPSNAVYCYTCGTKL